MAYRGQRRLSMRVGGCTLDQLGSLCGLRHQASVGIQHAASYSFELHNIHISFALFELQVRST
jgi:hypothetical protein